MRAWSKSCTRSPMTGRSRPSGHGSSCSAAAITGPKTSARAAKSVWYGGCRCRHAAKRCCAASKTRCVSRSVLRAATAAAAWCHAVLPSVSTRKRAASSTRHAWAVGNGIDARSCPLSVSCADALGASITARSCSRTTAPARSVCNGGCGKATVAGLRTPRAMSVGSQSIHSIVSEAPSSSQPMLSSEWTLIRRASSYSLMYSPGHVRPVRPRRWIAVWRDTYRK
mmetsp:Transcript_389/g.1499  ORF Transcript_389/g.1499 Transcript_389/m.1499 type:complete len:225 (-) Transcript_389:196-870(-)